MFIAGAGLMGSGIARVCAQAFYPLRLLRRVVNAGHLGRKTGKGWYAYDANGRKKEKNR